MSMIWSCLLTMHYFELSVYPDGRVCISILHPPGEDPNGYELASERWTPVHTVGLLLIRHIMFLPLFALTGHSFFCAILLYTVKLNQLTLHCVVRDWVPGCVACVWVTSWLVWVHSGVILLDLFSFFRQWSIGLLPFLIYCAFVTFRLKV